MQSLDAVMSKAIHTLMGYKYERENQEDPAQLISMIQFFDDEILRIKTKSAGLLGMHLVFLIDVIIG